MWLKRKPSLARSVKPRKSSRKKKKEEKRLPQQPQQHRMKTQPWLSPCVHHGRHHVDSGESGRGRNLMWDFFQTAKHTTPLRSTFLPMRQPRTATEEEPILSPLTTLHRHLK
ncbi:hypothetical protein MTO96_036180, partial [Rhipicephalus appendiculatus]